MCPGTICERNKSDGPAVGVVPFYRQWFNEIKTSDVRASAGADIHSAGADNLETSSGYDRISFCDALMKLISRRLLGKDTMEVPGHLGLQMRLKNPDSGDGPPSWTAFSEGSGEQCSRL